MTLPTLVLVHGAWGGAWVWRRLLAPLRAAGHDVHAVTLTGCGERAHLRTPGIGLQTHLDDLLGLIEAEELQDLVLVGHSYGGMVITAAAAVLRARDPARVGGLVYVDALAPLPGEGWGDTNPPEVVAARRAAAATHGNALPPPDPRDFGLEGADRDWLLRRHVPHPFGMYREPLHYDRALVESLPRLFIDCTRPAYAAIDPIRQRVRQQPGWQVVEMACGHFPMVQAPGALAEHLLAFASRRSGALLSNGAAGRGRSVC